MHDLIKRTPIKVLDRSQGAIGRITKRHENGNETILRQPQHFPGQVLVPAGGQSASHPLIGSHDGKLKGSLAKIESVHEAHALIVGYRLNKRDHIGCTCRESSPLPDRGQAGFLVLVGDDHKIPWLAVAPGRGEASALEDAAEHSIGYRLIGEASDLTARCDGAQCIHVHTLEVWHHPCHPFRVGLELADELKHPMHDKLRGSFVV